VGSLFLFHPWWLNSFQRQQEARQGFDLTEAALRVKLFAAALVDFVLPAAWLESVVDRIPGIGVGILLLVALLAVATAYWLVRERHVWSAKLRIEVAWLPAIVCTVYLLAQFLLYILNVTPQHAVGGRYLALISPWLFVVAGQLLHRLTLGTNRWPAILAALALYQVIYGATEVRTIVAQADHIIPPIAIVPDMPLFVDSVRQGILPRMLWSVPADTPVYAAAQTQLLGSFPVIPARVSTLGYVGVTRYEATQEMQQAVLREFERQGFQVVGRYPLGDAREIVYLLERTP
jgi:hypothetical protein